MNRLFRCLTIFFLFPSALFALPTLYVDYYGTISKSTDTNMIKMAQDLFYSQLKSIDNVTVTDMRNGTIYSDASDLSFTSTADGHVVFYAEIAEISEQGEKTTSWNCTLHAALPSKNINASTNEVYDSYYKILISAKSAIENVLKKITSSSNSETEQTPQTSFVNTVSTDMLAGTWSGESDTAKIVILRGGRGFVIFKNGASMTIKIDINNIGGVQTVLITQNGKPNASYYPSLPRKIALEAASTAEPIEWNMRLSSDDTMTGTKTTLVESSESPNGVVSGIENVTWKKK